MSTVHTHFRRLWEQRPQLGREGAYEGRRPGHGRRPHCSVRRVCTAGHTPNPAHALGDPDSQCDVGGTCFKRRVTQSQAPKARPQRQGRVTWVPATRQLPFSQRALCSGAQAVASGVAAMQEDVRAPETTLQNRVCVNFPGEKGYRLQRHRKAIALTVARSRPLLLQNVALPLSEHRTLVR